MNPTSLDFTPPERDDANNDPVVQDVSTEGDGDDGAERESLDFTSSGVCWAPGGGLLGVPGR